MKKMRNSRRGFTLVEIVLVIAIVVLLSAVSVIGIAATMSKAKNNQMKLEAQHGDNFEVVAWGQVNSIGVGSGGLYDQPEYTPSIEQAKEQLDEAMREYIDELKEQGYTDDEIQVTYDNEGYITDVTVVPKDKTGGNSNSGGSANSNGNTHQGNNDQQGGTQNGGTQQGGNQNGGTQQGGTQNGGTQQGGNQNGSTQQGGNQNGGTQHSGGQQSGTSTGTLAGANQWNLQGNAQINGDGRPIVSVTITVPDGVTINSVNDCSNGGRYKYDKSDDGSTVTVYYDESTSGWSKPSTSLNVNSIQWSGPLSFDYDYTIEYGEG